jgi:Rrf2 family protein
MALLRLAKEYGKGPVQISDIAQGQGIPQKFLESILNDCKKLGVVQSKMGKPGGYYLIKPPAEIDIASIYNHFEGPISMLSCASEKHYQSCEFCRDEEKCGIRKTFKRVRDLSYEILKNTTLQSLIDDDETTAYK